MQSKNTGFTIMELMIVVAIIGILVMIAVPSYHIYTKRAQFSEIIQAAAPYKLAVQQCFQITGDLNACVAGQNGVPENLADSSNLSLVKSIEVSSSGKITIIPKEKSGFNSNEDYTLTPLVENDRLLWQSGGGAVSEGIAG